MGRHRTSNAVTASVTKDNNREEETKTDRAPSMGKTNGRASFVALWGTLGLLGCSARGHRGVGSGAGLGCARSVDSRSAAGRELRACLRRAGSTQGAARGRALARAASRSAGSEWLAPGRLAGERARERAERGEREWEREVREREVRGEGESSRRRLLRDWRRQQACGGWKLGFGKNGTWAPSGPAGCRFIFFFFFKIPKYLSI
jgi:hypothetical protein